MSKLTDEQRAQRQKHRAEQRKAAIQARWQTEISKAEQLIPEAKAYLEANPLSDRETGRQFFG
jgi:hypothetical protein